jgi:predicted phosphodiesterase
VEAARVRALVLSDLHSNADALRAVLARVRRKKYDHVVCLGDFVGYGAQPNQVLDTMRMLRGAKKVYIRGNHDRVAAGLDEAEGFNAAAKHAALWTRERLSKPNLRFLRDLPLGPVQRDEVLLCHGSPMDEDEYVFNGHHAAQVFASCESPFILYGHTHMPVIFAVHANGYVEGASIRGDATIRLARGVRYLINPGSVGQPRDRNPLSSFAIVDTKQMTVQFFRVAYDIEKTRASILGAGLPRILADRLTHGT